jgi:antitoxin MazE
VLELLDIDQNTPLEITTDGKALVVSPVQDARRRKKFQAALAKVNRKYPKMLKRLAD